MNLVQKYLHNPALPELTPTVPNSLCSRHTALLTVSCWCLALPCPSIPHFLPGCLLLLILQISAEKSSFPRLTPQASCNWCLPLFSVHVALWAELNYCFCPLTYWYLSLKCKLLEGSFLGNSISATTSPASNKPRTLPVLNKY